jgi:hypothetical protein
LHDLNSSFEFFDFNRRPVDLAAAEIRFASINAAEIKSGSERAKEVGVENPSEETRSCLKILWILRGGSASKGAAHFALANHHKAPWLVEIPHLPPPRALEQTLSRGDAAFHDGKAPDSE